MRSVQSRLRQQRQREANRRRVYFSIERRGTIESEGDTVPPEGEGLCSPLSESGTRRQESEYEDRPD